ncbi:hypothetical protein [Azospirillum thermophilum]|uniref:Uncharacterized protein n=1 Tax=Azospirillum thermophilum TaxID=2202148 RepID=A0A2S2CMY3_9PROT|nr:hypothetical protein [Azospirillum thermophilum]AWK85677.1 hypothetical protein DEW08_05425 [Azospirillum thermophilum]
MWQDYSNALFSALGLSGLAFAIGKLVVATGERMIEKRHGTGNVRETITRRAKLETGLEARKGERAAQIKEADGAVQDMLRRRSVLERQLKDAQQTSEMLVRQIGEELAGTPCYLAMVVNKYVGNAAFQQKQHAFIDSSWSQPQMIEVWARSMAEARAEIERRYPPAFGYVVTRLQDMDKPVAKAG